MITLLSN